MKLKNSLPKKTRLNNSIIIREVFKKGDYKSLGPIGVKFRKSEYEKSRFAISVKKNVGNSPSRNRIKRLLREVIRIEKNNLTCSFYFCFFLIHPTRSKLDYNYIFKKISFFFKYLNEENCNEK